MQAERLVDLVHDRARDDADERADPVDGNGSDLLGLRFRVLAEARLRRRQHRLERVHTFLDALHLAAAERAGGRSLPVFTFDVRLAQAARALGFAVIGE